MTNITVETVETVATVKGYVLVTDYFRGEHNLGSAVELSDASGEFIGRRVYFGHGDRPDMLANLWMSEVFGAWSEGTATEYGVELLSV